MRVLLIAYTTYVHDGRVKRHAEALAERGDEVDVICLECGFNGLHRGVNIVGLEMKRYRGSSRLDYMRSYVRFFLSAAIRAARLSFKRNYDLVVVCTMPDAAVLCALLPKLLGSKVVLDVHDTMPELYRDKFGGRRGALGARLLMFEERASAWLANRVLAVHDLHRARLEQAGVRPDKIATVMNVPDPRIFQPLSNGHQPHGEFVVVCHGTVTHRLGLDVAIGAVELLRDRLPGIHLQVIGTGDYLVEAQRMVAAARLESRVSFQEPVPIEQLPALLEGASLGLVPNHASSATHLMLPVKLLEYATLGIPVVAARLDTIEHYFGPEAVCYFDPGDRAQLAGAIEQLYHRPEQRLALAHGASQVIARLGWNTQREQYYRAIDSLLPHQEART